MNRSLEQGKAVLNQTREGTSIEAELRNMDDSQASFFRIFTASKKETVFRLRRTNISLMETASNVYCTVMFIWFLLVLLLIQVFYFYFVVLSGLFIHFLL
jgi:hypothetical protein